MSKKKKQEFRKELEIKLLETFSLTGEAKESKRVKKGIKKAGKIISQLVRFNEQDQNKKNKLRESKSEESL